MSQKVELLEKLRGECRQRGAFGIKGISRFWYQIDDDRSRSLSKAEFVQGIQDHNINLSRDECEQLFDEFDADNSGTLNFNEFLLQLRPPLNERRMKLIRSMFDKLDKSKDGKITVEDMRGVYNARKHPKFLSGELTEDQVFQKFLNSFEASELKDGTVTWDEFVSYYTGVSASIDDDQYFEAVMKI